jgi:hypothetical protein
MEQDEALWLAYLDQVAAQKATQQGTSSEASAAAPSEAAPAKSGPASPFACEELPPE